MAEQNYQAGTYKKYSLQAQDKLIEYNAFIPSRVNKEYEPSNKNVFLLLEKATQHLATLNSHCRLISHIDLFMDMHIKNEAVESSKIEGIHTSIDDSILSDKDITADKKDDWEEVQNYIKALNYGVKHFKKQKISVDFICTLHKVLMQGVRGETKGPGKIRTKQNWIGSTYSRDIRDATFVPPHPNDIPDTLKDLEEFWNNSDLKTPNLIKVAISHYQFETIHPFSDGNGRAGRILIILQLMEMGMLDKPMLYLAHFFEQHRREYYDALSRVRDDNDIDQWILFFLHGIVNTSKKGVQTLEKIIALEKEYQNKILNLGVRARQASDLLQYAFKHPAFRVVDIQEYLNVSSTTTNDIIQDLIKLNILKEITGYSRNRIFVLHEYVDLFK